MTILVFLQHIDGELPKTALVTLEAASQIAKAWKQERIVTLCLGPSADKAAQNALQYGVSEALFSTDSSLEKYRAPHFAAAIISAAESAGAETIVSAATSTGKDTMPRVAAHFQAGQASDIIGVNSDGTLKRPMYAGDIIADVEILSPKKIVTVRASAFSPIAGGGSTGSTKAITFTAPGSELGEVTNYETAKAERPELSDASVVVSGGRALGSSDNFEKYVFPLADALGAAVGASRAAVDSGYAPNDWQVGQTGKIVAPQLYIAVGISGAIQHLAGMKDSKTIVAINKDPDAPIYEVATYGLVADLFEVVPQLTAEIKKRRA